MRVEKEKEGKTQPPSKINIVEIEMHIEFQEREVAE